MGKGLGLEELFRWGLGQTIVIAPHPTPIFPSSSHLTSFLRPLSFTSAPPSPKIQDLGNQIKTITLEEARGLVDWLQSELGVSPAAFTPAATPAAAVEKMEFDVVIEDVPSNARIATIKVVRALKEAKELNRRAAEENFEEAVSKEEAEEAKKQLEQVGAKIAIV